jgi:hypothetical protein
VSGEIVQILDYAEESIGPLLQLSDGKLAYVAECNTIKLWNITEGVCEKTLRGRIRTSR